MKIYAQITGKDKWWGFFELDKDTDYFWKVSCYSLFDFKDPYYSLNIDERLETTDRIKFEESHLNEENLCNS